MVLRMHNGTPIFTLGRGKLLISGIHVVAPRGLLPCSIVALLLLRLCTPVLARQADCEPLPMEQATKWIVQGIQQKKIAELSSLIKKHPSAQLYELRAELYAQMLQPNAAVEDYTAALALNPKCAQCYSRRSSSYRVLGLRELAVSDIKKACQVDPGNSRPWLYLALHYSTLAKYDEAVECFDKAIALDPHQAQYYLKRGLSRLHIGQFTEAEQDFSTADRLQKDLGMLGRAHCENMNGHYQKALEYATIALRMNEDASNYEARAMALVGLNRIEEACSDYDSAIKLSTPGSAMYYHALKASAYSNKDQFKAAADELYRSLEIKPSYCPAVHTISKIVAKMKVPLNERIGLLSKIQARTKCNYPSIAQGDLYVAKKLYSDAFAAYKIAYKLNAKSVEAVANISACCYKLNDKTRAADWSQKALKLEPEHALRVLAEAYKICGLPQKAHGYMNELIRRDPTEPESYAAIIDLCMTLHHDKEADAYADKVCHLKVLDQNVLRTLAGEFYNLKRWKDCLKASEKYLKRQPQEVEPRLWSAYSLSALHQAPQAISSASAALRIAMQSAHKQNTIAAYKALADIYKEDGQFSQSYTLYSKLIELDPQDWDHYCGRAEAGTCLGLGKVAQSIEDCTTVLLHRPNDDRPLMVRAHLYYHDKQYDKAIQDYTKLIATHPWTHFYEFRAKAYEFRNRYDLAADDYTHMIKSNDSRVSLYYNRGECYLKLGEYNKAIQDMSVTIARVPSETRAYTRRAQAYRKVGKVKLAERDEAVVKQVIQDFGG